MSASKPSGDVPGPDWEERDEAGFARGRFGVAGRPNARPRGARFRRAMGGSSRPGISHPRARLATIFRPSA